MCACLRSVRFPLLGLTLPAQATNTFGLLGYLPCAAMGVRRLVASDTERPMVSWPTASFAARRAAAANEGLLSAWRRSVAPAVHSTASAAAPSELLPFLLTVMGPTLRTVSVHAMAPAEKATLADLVDTMVSYGVHEGMRVTACTRLTDAPRRRAGLHGAQRRGRAYRHVQLRARAGPSAGYAAALRGPGGRGGAAAACTAWRAAPGGRARVRGRADPAWGRRACSSRRCGGTGCRRGPASAAAAATRHPGA